LKQIEKFNKIDYFIQCHEGIHTGNCRELLFVESKINLQCYPLFFGGGAGDVIDNYFSKTKG
jgi:adenine-specific DNA-methyltransferase